MAEDTAWEQHSKTVTTAVREITPDGIKLEFNYEGKTSGRVKAQTNGTTTVWAKPDGSSTWEDKLLGMTSNGDMFVAWGKGTGRMTTPGTTTWEGEVQTMSQSPGLSWLNNLRFKATGTADMGKGESRGQFQPSR
jgi:hypothetical protein